MSSETSSVLTVGHSSHSLKWFIELVEMNGVTAVADVRSWPFSRLYPSFNRDELSQSLRERGIEYVYLGRELGGRFSDPTCYEDGRIKYQKVARTTQFKKGLKRVVAGAKTHRVALLCSEKEPLECHRSLLIARELEALGTPVSHIHGDGSVETHSAAMRRLLRALRLPEADLFRNEEDMINEAYALQEERVAFVNERMRSTSKETA
jgi:uncharacterized protein (DUF488 family)